MKRLEKITRERDRPEEDERERKRREAREQAASESGGDHQRRPTSDDVLA